MKKIWLLLVVVIVCAFVTSAGAMDLKGKFGLTGQGGLAIPFGDFSDKDKLAAKTGFGFGGAAEYFVNNNIAIGGTFRYDMHDIQDAEDASWKITNFGAFFKYIFPTGSKIMPYVRLDAGFFKPKLSGSSGDFEASLSFSTKMGIGGGGGVMYQASENVLIGGELLFQNAMTSDAKAAGWKLDSDIQYISIFAGITFLVGGPK
jgi:opacity protein-like surface antigen